MAKTAHTPGPWRAWQPRGDESVPVRTDGLGITIAYVHQGAVTDAQANARLIAAAPEMYDELRTSPCPRPANCRPDDFTAGQCVDARECGCSVGRVIAKAEGREPNDGDQP